MDAKEKAKLLVYGFREYAKDLVAKEYELRYSKDEETDNAKQCALVCVDELIKEHTWKSPIGWNIERKKFWESVKYEIENL